MRVNALVMLMLVLSFVGCTKDIGDKNQVSRAKYDDLVKKYNDGVTEHNALVRQNNKSDALLITTGNLVSDLDTAAANVRQQTKKVREGLSSTRNPETLKSDMQELDAKIQSALVLVAKLEQQTSKKNIEQIIANSNLTIKESAQLEYKLKAIASGATVSSLAGLRDLFLAQYNDVVDAVNLRLRELPGNLTPADINPARQGNLVPETQSPIVTGLESGGRITGIARDSVSGAPIARANVGFRKLRESTDYFYETTTDNTGQYTSPYLLPGTYYVDIKRDGYIKVEAQAVQIRRGQQSSENISMTEPLKEGVYRVTLSWTGEKAGAVSDVDSYLQIPGTSKPLSYLNKSVAYAGSFLDRDDTDWIGPETITIHEVKSGTYIYYVNNYNQRRDPFALGNSEVRVKLYKGQNLVHSFEVPPGRGLNYEMFRIENGVVRVTGRFDDQLLMHH